MTSTPTSDRRRPARLPITEEPVFDASSLRGFTPAEEFSLLDQAAVLPNVDEFLPKRQIDPWHRMSALEHDCILVVEFSELEGPKPSLCIPESPGAHFERNDFSVWLMTADYQASNHRGGPFFINEDIQMLLSNEEQGVHTYAHHFTLFDIEARGYVRPFCATYVTPDSEKLTRLFDALRAEFSGVLRTVKMCNRRQFRKALTEAVEALNVIETQAISGYYELYYDKKLDASGSESATPTTKSNNTSPSHISRQEKPDVLNMRYRGLQRELMLAQNVVADDLRAHLCQYATPSTTNGRCGAHIVNMDHWINSMRRGEGVERQKKTLKEFHELCPCVFDEFQRRMRSVWMKYRHWNTTASRILEPTPTYRAKVNVGSVPILYLPPPSSKRDESCSDSRRTTSRRGRLGDFSITEVDALHYLIHSRSQQRGASADDQEQKRLLLNVAPHLRYFLYPILTGQLLVAYGSDLRRQLIIDLIQKLKSFIPTIFASPRCLVWNDEAASDSGAIPESALSDYKIMGLRVGQKENISDFINEEMKRYVALLDLNNDVFHAAEYKGDILNRLMARAASHKSDWTLTLAVLATVSEYASLSYILYYSTPVAASTATNATNGFLSLQRWKSKEGGSKTKDAGVVLKLQSGDLRIARYLAELLKMQSEEMDEGEENAGPKGLDGQSEDGLLLDYEPAHSHKM